VVRVLVVEDDRNNAELFRDVLELDRHEPTVVATLDEAEARVLDGWDLIVVGELASSVCRLDETEAAQLRRLGGTAPLLLCLGNSWAGELSRQEVGAAGLLPKPFRVEGLRAAARALGPVHQGRA
jgi:DNA-binding response OmpR family regulator